MEAIREDVSPEEQGEQQFVNPRDNALEEIAARREQELNAEIPDEEKEPPVEEEPEEPPQEAAEAPQEEPEPEYEIKVDGVVQKVPLSKLLDAGKRTLQKESAADKRLEEASRLKAELERYKEWMATQQRGAVQQKSPQDEWKDRINNWREALQYGDAETANKAMMEFLAAGAQLATPQIRAVEEKLVAERHNEAIRTRFTQEFADIAQDEKLFNVATAIVDSRRNQGDTRNDWEFYAEIGEFVRSLKPQAPQPVAVDIKARQEKKRAAETVPTMSGRVAVPQEKEPTREDILAEMRKSRAG